MILRSFRLKIALISGLATGLLLAGAGGFMWRVSRQFNLDRLDREIRSLGQASLDREHGPAHYQRFEEALAFISGQDKPLSFLILVRGRRGAIEFLSSNWPKSLDPESFPALPPPPRGSLSDPAPRMPPLRPPPEDEPPPDRPGPPQNRRGPPARQDPQPLPLSIPRFETRQAGERVWRFGIMGNGFDTLALGMDLGPFNADMARFQTACLLGLAAVLGLASLSAWFLAQRALRPVDALARAAESVTARGLDRRIPAMTRDQEFNRLVVVFNEMMDRLQKSFEQATRFSADACHELQTPLARLQAELEDALESAPAGSPHQELCGSLLDEVSRLKAIVKKLLLLSLADAGRLQLHCDPVQLGSMIQNVIEDSQALETDLALDSDLAPGLLVSADPALLEQALQNLATNALKYNQPGGRVHFSLAAETSRAVLRVSNTGPGIPPSARARVFQRFYRADPSRSERVEGAGLGLSLSREILRAHGGDLVLEASDETLTVFTAWLPLTASTLPAEA